MAEVSIIGLDLAKHRFQVHGAASDGSVLFRKKLTRAQVLPFFAKQPRCIVAMEACATAHDWGREIGKLRHEVKLIPPIYVKPFVKRQKNDASDAEAIAEYGSVAPKKTVHLKRLVEILKDPQNGLPPMVVEIGKIYLLVRCRQMVPIRWLNRTTGLLK